MMRSSVFFELRLKIRNPWRDPVFQVGIFRQQPWIGCQDLFREWRRGDARDFMHLFLFRPVKVRCPFTPVYESMKNRETMIYFRTVCSLRADVCAFRRKKQTKNKSAVNSVRTECVFNPVASSPFREQTIIDP